ncbi:MAG: AlkZ family DNA glycosylase [Propionibacteriaceae bacterium]|nr:AlkZ family DNA glycosylase [Propionibacteriaceae bacterium]
MDRTAVLNSRLATQRLSGPPAAGPAQVVRELLCVQSQDAPLARAMIALRCAGATGQAAQEALAAGEIVRTHILRPTWHYVAATDLKWLLQLTSPKVESGMAARHRVLGLDENRVAAGLAELGSRLAGRSFANRAELGAGLAAAGLLAPSDPLFGQQVGHLIMLAELRGLVCSAPLSSSEHRYALVEEVVPATPDVARPDAITQLVLRFIAGHGPVALTDLIRWARVTLGEARAALAGLGKEVARVDVDGEELWYSPAKQLDTIRPKAAWLLSTFDEAFLSYRRVPWPRSAGHPAGVDAYRFAEAGGGVVVLGTEDVGGWKRKRVRGGARIELEVDESLPRSARTAIDEAVDRLLAAIGWPDA